MWTDEAALFYRFAVALGIGMVIGFERERRRQTGAEMFAGVRTFAILALVGATSALIADQTGTPWPLVAAVVAVAGLLVSAYSLQSRSDNDAGLTTEVAALLTTLIGALCVYEYVTLAAAIGVATLVLLSMKPQLHRVAERITWSDLEATIKFKKMMAAVQLKDGMPQGVYRVEREGVFGFGHLKSAAVKGPCWVVLPDHVSPGNT